MTNTKNINTREGGMQL